jgi:hypothetical protein
MVLGGVALYLLLAAGADLENLRRLFDCSTRKAAKIFGFQPLSHCCQSAHARAVTATAEYHFTADFDSQTRSVCIPCNRLPRSVPRIVLRDSEGGGTACTRNHG